jgi:hypothetical protein
MKPTRIILDLDDVLNCFTPYVLHELGCRVASPHSYEDHPRESGWDIVDAANRLHPSKCWTTAGFWADVKRLHWASVPRSREFGNLLYLAVWAVGAKNVFILTSPTLDPDCLAGKLEWIQGNCPPWLHRQYLIGPAKHVCAQPGALLIDDNEDNAAAFRDNGGQAMLMPRPWNRFAGTTNMPSYLSRAFRRIFRKEVAA